MASSGSSKWLAFGGAILIAAIAADSLVPVAWQVRSGLHWLTEHFLRRPILMLMLGPHQPPQPHPSQPQPPHL
jgi:hypothetical protein